MGVTMKIETILNQLNDANQELNQIRNDQNLTAEQRYHALDLKARLMTGLLDAFREANYQNFRAEEGDTLRLAVRS